MLLDRRAGAGGALPAFRGAGDRATSPAMTERRASGACGQLGVTCEGEPVRISMCHCLACQQRSRSV
jgi:hypothetical protein